MMNCEHCKSLIRCPLEKQFVKTKVVKKCDEYELDECCENCVFYDNDRNDQPCCGCIDFENFVESEDEEE